MAISDYLFTQDARGNVPAVNLASAVLGIVNANNARSNLTGGLAPTAYDQGYQQQFDYYSNLLKQLTGQLADTSSPEFQRRLQTRLDEIMRSHQDAIRQQQAIEARRSVRGVPGVVNAERRDELMSRNLAALRQQAEAQARAEVMKEMAQAAQTGIQGAQAMSNAGAVGLSNERIRRMATANVNDAYNMAGSQAWFQLAKEIGMPLIKAIGSGSLSQGVLGPPKGTDLSDWLARDSSVQWPSTGAAPGAGFRPTAASPASSPGAWWGAPLGQPSAATSFNPKTDISDWWAQDTSVQMPTSTLPDFTKPNAPDLSDWWAKDTSVQWPQFTMPDFTAPNAPDLSDWWAQDTSGWWK